MDNDRNARRTKACRTWLPKNMSWLLVAILQKTRASLTKVGRRLSVLQINFFKFIAVEGVPEPSHVVEV